MEQSKVGDVVTVNFPFSDMKNGKLRPALVVARAEFENVILCQITSKPYSSAISIKLTETDFSSGSLPLTSYIRPDKIFTAEMSIINSTAGQVNKTALNNVLKKLRDIFTI
jgi:mRNA interferase MazF